jgi:hypothetical protein
VKRTVQLWRSQRAVLRDIVTLVVPAYPELDAATRATVEHDVTRYVASQIQQMPRFLRLPYKLAVVSFNWLALPRYARPFRRLPAERQSSYLALWSEAPFGPMRDFVKLIRSSALLVYFDHPLVRQRLEAERQQVPELADPTIGESRKHEISKARKGEG